MHASARAAAAYRQTAVQSSSPLGLVVLLYDGALKHVVAAREAIRANDLRARRDHLSRTLAIVSELQSTLDVEKGGDIARSLDSLYTYITGRVLDVNLKKDATALDEVERLLGSLREAWAQIADAPAPAGMAR
jgi:flagellar protein FliS